MIYITGDTHGSFERFAKIKDFCKEHGTTIKDTMIILGDSGINYYEDARDNQLKDFIVTIPITFFCIHGNHEQRAECLIPYKFRYGNEYYFTISEEQYPNIQFALDDYSYVIEGKTFIVYGGGYSVDKEMRLMMQDAGYSGYKYWENELPSDEIINEWRQSIQAIKNIYFYSNPIILSHTCPKKYTPYEAFLPNIDQSKVDTRLEEFLDEVEETLDYRDWYCGHFHINKNIDKIHFLFDNIVEVK